MNKVTTYNKLVRDNIPTYLQSLNKIPMTHIATEEEYWIALLAKLREETDEFISDQSAAELADILEVMQTICRYKNIDWLEVEQLRTKKAAERGGFGGQIILEKVSEKDPKTTSNQ